MRHRAFLNRRQTEFVMPGHVPGIHAFLNASKKDVDGRDKPGHDETTNYRSLETLERDP
jgi:hypothetical protein